jgi:hypothetical protein
LGNLLKFVDGHNARLVGGFEVGKDFVYGGLRLLNAAQPDVKNRLARCCIQLKTWSQRLDGSEEFLCPLRA